MNGPMCTKYLLITRLRFSCSLCCVNLLLQISLKQMKTMTCRWMVYLASSVTYLALNTLIFYGPRLHTFSMWTWILTDSLAHCALSTNMMDNVVNILKLKQQTATSKLQTNWPLLTIHHTTGYKTICHCGLSRYNVKLVVIGYVPV